MTRDLGVLRGALPPLAGEGLEAIDPRLVEINDLVDARRGAEAADRAAALMAEGVFDIRAIAVYLLQAFAEGGLDALAPIFEALGVLVGDNLVSLGPARRREDHVQRRIDWLCKQIVDLCEYNLKKGTDQWVVLQGADPARAVGAALEAARSLTGVLAGPLAPAKVSVGRVVDFLSRLDLARVASAGGQGGAGAGAASASSASSDAGEGGDASGGDASGGDASGGDDQGGDEGDDAPRPTVGAGRAPRGGAGSLVPVRRRVEIEVSHAFVELVAKLAAFEELVRRGDMTKAAIVSDDVNRLLDAFDPRAYFPGLLSNYTRLVSEHIEDLATGWSEREGVVAQSLAQFYRVDLARFVGK